MRSPLAAILALATCLSGTATAAPLADSAKADITASIDKRQAALAGTARQIWEFAEVGYQETRSSALLQDILRKGGFAVKAGVADIPTAFVASYRTGDGPVIAILGEFDALPGLSQAAEPVRKAVAGRTAGHGCGHNLFGAASVEAALAVKQWMDAAGIKGEIRLYGTPAEEGGGAKVYMSRAGLFDDVGVVLHWHPGDENTAAQDLARANISGKFRFRGLSAHASSRPHMGRSALDGVQVMDVAVNFMREHVPETVRIHSIITSGGSAPNVVPDFAESYYYVRDWDSKVVTATLDRIRKAADGAAMATETSVEFELINGVYGLLPNDVLGRMMDANLRYVGTPAWTAEDLAFAEALRKTLPEGGKPIEEGRQITAYDTGGPGSGGSTDVGDVSWVVPTVGLRVATYPPGTPAHSWQAVASAGSPFGAKGAVVAAKTMALTAAELMESPDAVSAARAEFDKRRGAGFAYRPLIGDRVPPLDYRKGAAQ